MPKYRAITEIRRNRARFLPGDVLDIPEQEAAPLVGVGAAEIVEDPKPQTAKPKVKRKPRRKASK